MFQFRFLKIFKSTHNPTKNYWNRTKKQKNSKSVLFRQEFFKSWLLENSILFFFKWILIGLMFQKSTIEMKLKYQRYS